MARAERHRLTLEPRGHLPARPAKLAQEPGFPDARLAHDGHDLALARARLLEALAEEPELGLPAHEPARVAHGHRCTDQPAGLARHPAHGPGRNELEAARQEHRPLGAHDRRARFRAVRQHAQDFPDPTPGVGVDLEGVADTRDRDALRVEGEREARRTGIIAPGRDRPLDRQRRVGRPTRGIVEGLEPEHRHDPAGADLVDRPAEAPDLVEHHLDRPARVHGSGSHRAGREAEPEQGHAARRPFPSHARRGSWFTGRTGRRGSAARRPGAHAPR
jgi:hypothetical protein